MSTKSIENPIKTPWIVRKFCTEDHKRSRWAIPKKSLTKLKPINGKSKEHENPPKTNPSSWFAPIYDLVRNWCKSFGEKSQLTSLIKVMQQKRIKTSYKWRIKGRTREGSEELAKNTSRTHKLLHPPNTEGHRRIRDLLPSKIHSSYTNRWISGPISHTSN
jgi:hypothetical protein